MNEFNYCATEFEHYNGDTAGLSEYGPTLRFHLVNALMHLDIRGTRMAQKYNTLVHGSYSSINHCRPSLEQTFRNSM